MFTRLKTAALSALVAFGTLAAIPATAQADGLYLNFGGRDGVGIRFGESHRADRWDRRHDRRHERRHERRAERCSPERALWKADRIGVNRARVVDVSKRSIVVRGRARGDRVTVVFGRAPNCPIIR